MTSVRKRYARAESFFPADTIYRINTLWEEHLLPAEVCWRDAAPSGRKRMWGGAKERSHRRLAPGSRGVATRGCWRKARARACASHPAGITANSTWAQAPGCVEAGVRGRTEPHLAGVLCPGGCSPHWRTRCFRQDRGCLPWQAHSWHPRNRLLMLLYDFLRQVPLRHSPRILRRHLRHHGAHDRQYSATHRLARQVRLGPHGPGGRRALTPAKVSGQVSVRTAENLLRRPVNVT
jgi:hypothetical protein